jgi:group I intron endonuclease
MTLLKAYYVKDKVCCVYKIDNIKNGKFYVGGTTNYFHRRSQHLYNLRKSSYANTPLQEDFLQFGEQFFVFSILKMSTPETLEKDEQFWIDTLHPTYNMSRFAKKPDELIVFSEKANLSRSAAVKKLWENPDFRANFSAKNKGRISNRKGVHLSDETKEKLRQANLGENSPRFGKKQPQSFVDRMSKTYHGVVSPDGIIYSPVINMSAFCREHGLDTGSMAHLMKGETKSHKGWTKLLDGGQ